MVKKCVWCQQESEHLIRLYEVHGSKVGEPIFICRKHLIPGEDPCPHKLYRLREDGDQIRREWFEGNELKEAILSRCEWFKEHPEARIDKDVWPSSTRISSVSSKSLIGNRYSWFEDHPNEITR